MVRSELKTYEPTGISWTALQEIDEGKSPMPNEGMKAIGRICDQAGVSMSALASVRSGGLSGLVAGNSAAMPAARSISGANAAALAAGVAGLASALAAKSSSGKEKKDASKSTHTASPGGYGDADPTPTGTKKTTYNLFDGSDRAALKETLERDSRGLTTTTQSTPSKTPPPPTGHKEGDTWSITSKPQAHDDGSVSPPVRTTFKQVGSDVVEVDSQVAIPPPPPPPQVDTNGATTKVDNGTTTTPPPKCDPNLSTCPEPIMSSADTNVSSSAKDAPK